MKLENIKIGEIPAIMWGEKSDNLYLYVHGQGGNKEEASLFAQTVCQKGFQVLSIDLPEHGERSGVSGATFDPWHAVPELKKVMGYAKNSHKNIYLFANSIGAWFSMLAFFEETLKGCLFVSPVVDMKALVSKIMAWANVTEAQLQREKIIATDFGQTLSWEYWEYILEHPIGKWEVPTAILYGENDHLADRFRIESFSEKTGCVLTVMKNGEHWFHTEDQLKFMSTWIESTLYLE